MKKDSDKTKSQLISELMELRRFATIFGIAEDAIISIDADYKITFFNKGAEKIFGYSSQEVIGKPLDMLLPKRFVDGHNQHIQEFAKAKDVARRMGERRTVAGLRKDGSEFPAEASISKFESDQGFLFTVILRDITERKKLEEELSKARNKLEEQIEQQEEEIRNQAELLDFAPDAIFILDLEDNIIFWSKGAEQIYGWSKQEAISKNIHSLLSPQNDIEAPVIRRLLFEKGEWSGELRRITKDGRSIFIESRRGLVRDVDNRPKAQFVVNTDITVKKQLESQFLRAQRMESIGTLAGGIAHDLNNVLTPIMMGLQLLQDQLPDPDSRQMMKALGDHAQRGADMVKQVLSFARGIEGERILVQPNHLIKEIKKICDQTLPKSIKFITYTPSHIWPVKGDATQLHQVIMNICINARDAMPEGGEITIKVSNINIDEQYSQMQINATPGRFVVITISDTGTGMPSETVGKIFEPFFTTKEVGKGTGLGLSTAMAIIKSHGGFITVYSEPERGTTFNIHIPAFIDKENESSQVSQQRIKQGNGELILVIDDEALIRQMTKFTLEKNGYQVITANDGAQGVATYAVDSKKIDLVLLDMMMPNLDGHATAKILLQINPDIKIITASGYAPHAKETINVKAFLPKPYTAERLLEVIAEVLQRA